MNHPVHGKTIRGQGCTWVTFKSNQQLATNQHTSESDRSSMKSSSLLSYSSSSDSSSSSRGLLLAGIVQISKQFKKSAPKSQQIKKTRTAPRPTNNANSCNQSLHPSTLATAVHSSKKPTKNTQKEKENTQKEHFLKKWKLSASSKQTKEKQQRHHHDVTILFLVNLQFAFKINVKSYGIGWKKKKEGRKKRRKKEPNVFSRFPIWRVFFFRTTEHFKSVLLLWVTDLFLVLNTHKNNTLCIFVCIAF